MDRPDGQGTVHTAHHALCQASMLGHAKATPPPMPWKNAAVIMEKCGKGQRKTQETAGNRGKWKNVEKLAKWPFQTTDISERGGGGGLEWANLPKQMSTTSMMKMGEMPQVGKNGEMRRGSATPALRSLESENPISHVFAAPLQWLMRL